MIDLVRVRTDILYSLISKDYHRIEAEKERLCGEDSKLGGTGLGFLVGDFYITCDPGRAPNRRPCKPQVLDDAMELVAEIKYFEAAKRNLESGLHILLASCETPQDIRDALPEIAIGELPSDVGSLPRTRPEAYTLDEKPLQKHAYQKTRQLIEEFISNRIIY